MKLRDLLATGLLAFIIGVSYGWNLREETTDHRYVRALAERHEAEAHYWLNKLDEQIQYNKGTIARERNAQK